MKRILSITFCAISFFALAQNTPQKLSYQAVARNTAGVTINNQLIGVKAEIVDADQTTALYVETHSVTTNQFGLFTLQIGGGTVSSGTFSTINWGGGNKFIRTSVDLTGGTNYQLMGMSQLLSVPYALYAAKTNLVAGNAINITNGNTIAANYTAGTGINISGSTISATNGSQWTNHTNGIYSTSSIGVGTTPQQYVPLTVATVGVNNLGNAVAHFKSSDTWHSSIGIMNGTTGSEKQYSFILAGSANTNLIPGAFGLYNNQTSSWTYNTDASNNNLAIGSSSLNANLPKSKLHVFNGDINIEQIGSGIILKSPNGSCWRITIDNTGNLVRTAITCP